LAKLRLSPSPHLFLSFLVFPFFLTSIKGREKKMKGTKKKKKKKTENIIRPEITA
jgi:hypothetical protein